jgi:response regulator RpfG family c-di-GMP phosphodiesterase
MVKGIQPDAVRLVLSASHEFETVVHAVNQAEVFRYIAKPWQQEELAKTIKLAFSRRDEMLEERRLADEARARESELSPRELEERRLEAEEPGITKVKWGADGSVQLE